jgi:uncharacterized membrane protein YgaE (UPF0421/DUF939 family)
MRIPFAGRAGGEDEQFLIRWLNIRSQALGAGRRRDLLDAAAARSRASSQDALARLRGNLWPLVQTAVAAAVAWFFATRVLGHAKPFFAPVAAIMSLGATRGQRLRRALELMLGVALGIGLGELLIRAIGIGFLQLALTVGLAMAAATMLGARLLLLSEAAVSATLVATVSPATHGFPPPRLLDALVGGTVALVFSQLLFPVHPIRVVREAAEGIVDELAGTLEDLASAAEERDLEASEDAVLKARRISSEWSSFEQALDMGREAAQYAPVRRRQRSRFADYLDVELPLGLMVRDVHVLARGVVRALTIGDEIPSKLTGALRDLSRATGGLIGRLGGRADGSEVRSLALRATHTATALASPGENLSLGVLIGYTQATAADLLRALGMDREPAHEKVGEAAVAAQR